VTGGNRVRSTNCNDGYDARWEVYVGPTGGVWRTIDDQYPYQPVASEVPYGQQDRRTALLRARQNREGADNVVRTHDLLLDKLPTMMRAWNGPRMLLPSNWGYQYWSDVVQAYPENMARHDLVSGMLELDGIWVHGWGNREDPTSGDPMPHWLAWSPFLERVKNSGELRQVLANGEVTRRAFGLGTNEDWLQISVVSEPTALPLFYAVQPPEDFWAAANAADYFSVLLEIDAFNWTAWRLGRVVWLAVTFSRVRDATQLVGTLAVLGPVGANLALEEGPEGLAISQGPATALRRGGPSVTLPGNGVHLDFPSFEGALLRLTLP